MNIYDDIAIEILKLAFVHEFPECHRVRCPSPLPISQVNRWWRRVALSTPQIWACIHVSTYIRPPREVLNAYLATTTHLFPVMDVRAQRDPAVEMAAAYLERSQQLPLSITIAGHKESTLAVQNWTMTGRDTRFAYHRTFGLRYLAAWKLAFAHHHRWRHFALYPHLSTFLEKVMKDMLGATFPLLEHLGIHVVKDRLAIYPLYFSAPKLAHFRTTGIGIAMSSPVSVNALTELYLVKMAVEVKILFRVLAVAPIATLVLFEVLIPDHSDEARHPYPRLQRLCLSGVSRPTGRMLFANAVALKSLFLCNDSIHLAQLLTAQTWNAPCALPLLEELRMLGRFRSNDLHVLLRDRMSIGHPIAKVIVDHCICDYIDSYALRELCTLYTVRCPERAHTELSVWNDETDDPEFFPLEAEEEKRLFRD